MGISTYNALVMYSRNGMHTRGLNGVLAPLMAVDWHRISEFPLLFYSVCLLKSFCLALELIV